MLPFTRSPSLSIQFVPIFVIRHTFEIVLDSFLSSFFFFVFFYKKNCSKINETHSTIRIIFFLWRKLMEMREASWWLVSEHCTQLTVYRFIYFNFLFSFVSNNVSIRSRPLIFMLVVLVIGSTLAYNFGDFIALLEFLLYAKFANTVRF